MGAAGAMYAIGAGVSAVGALSLGKSQQQAAEYNAQIARQNAMLAKKQAERDAALVKQQGFKSMGAMRAAVGASGLTMEGSFTDIMMESAFNIKQDELNILYQGELAARGFEVEARQQIFAGEVARVQSRYRAVSALMTGGAQSYGASDLGSPKRTG